MNAVIINGEFNVALSVLRSLGKKDIDTTVVAKDRHALSFYSKYCNHKAISDYNIDFFKRMSGEDIIMPMDEDVMLLLAKNKQRLRCRLPFSEYSTLEKIINKSSLIRHAMENKIPCPKTCFVNGSDTLDGVAKELDFPVVIKPNSGTGGSGIAIVDSPEELKNTYRHVLKNYGPASIQEKIPFKEKYKVQALLNSDSKARRVTVLKVHRAYPLVTGPSVFVETVERPDLVNYSLKLLESLNYYGMADFDFVIDERNKKPVLMEINPRFWKSIQAAITSGVDYPYLLYKMAVEGDIDVSLNYKLGVKCRFAIFNDLYRLLAVLRGNYPLSYKLTNIVDYLKFHQDDSYYIFELEDVKPFLALIPIKLHRKFGAKKDT